MSDVVNNNPLESVRMEVGVNAAKLPETEVVDTAASGSLKIGLSVIACASLTVSVGNVSNSNAATINSHREPPRKPLRESKKLHCPFYWQEDLDIKRYGDHEIDFLSEFEEMSEELSFTLRSFHRFVTQLVKCYHNFYKRLVEDSIENMNEMERMLCRSTRETGHDPLFSKIRDALLHVMNSCRLYVLETTNQVEEALQLLEKIKPYKAMDETNKAAIWGIRAAVYIEYGYEATKSAIEYTSKAIQLDRKNAFWLFFRGLYLGRLRCMEKTSISVPEEEIVSLEAALRKRKDATFYSFTAGTYLEIVGSIEKKLETNSLNIKDNSSAEKISGMLDKFTKTAADYFEKSVEMEESNAHLLFRYGRSLMQLRHPHQNLKKAEELLQKGLTLSPTSSYGNYAMALLFWNYKKDIEAAELYLEKSVTSNNFLAHLDLCRKRLLEDKSSVLLELERLLDVYKDIPRVCKLYGELICCRLFVRNDLVKACDYARNLIDLQSTWINYIYKFDSGIFPFPKSVPLIELLVSEIRNKLYHEKTAEVEKNSYKTFIRYILDEEIEIPENIPRDILLCYSKDFEEGLRTQSQCLNVKPKVTKQDIPVEDGHRRRNLRNSGNSEYHKYYIAQKDRDVCDILQPDLLYENSSKEEGRKTQEVPHEKKHDLHRRHHSRSSSASSSNSDKALKRLTKDLESLVVAPCKKKTYTLDEGCSSSSSVEISSETSRRKVERVHAEENRVSQSKRCDRNSAKRMNNNSSSSLERKSLKSKSSRSRRKHYLRRYRSSDDSSSSRSSSSSGSESYKSKYSHKYEDRDNKLGRSKKHSPSESDYSDECKSREEYKRRNDRRREKSHRERRSRERSYSSDRSRHHRQRHDKNNHVKSDRSRRHDHSKNRHR